MFEVIDCMCFIIASYVLNALIQFHLYFVNLESGAICWLTSSFAMFLIGSREIKFTHSFVTGNLKTTLTSYQLYQVEIGWLNISSPWTIENLKLRLIMSHNSVLPKKHTKRFPLNVWTFKMRTLFRRHKIFEIGGFSSKCNKWLSKDRTEKVFQWKFIFDISLYYKIIVLVSKSIITFVVFIYMWR